MLPSGGLRIPHSTRPLVGLLLVALALPTGALAFHGDDLPVVATLAGDGSASYALRLDHPGGDFAIDLAGVGPQTAQSLSLGAYFFDGDGNVVFGIAFTGHGSPDRMVFEPVGAAGAVSLLPSWMQPRAAGAGSGGCAFACLGLEARGAPAGTYRYLLFVAGAGASALEVRSAGETRVTASVGEAWSVTDAEMRGGAIHLQAQRAAAAGQAVGAKAMMGAGTSVEVTHALYGFWGTADFKLACQFVVGACAWRSALDDGCWAAGAGCDATATSWSGPAGTGSGPTSFLGTPAGTYDFRIDRKLDAYGPGAYDATTGTWVALGEEYTFLVAADARMP